MTQPWYPFYWSDYSGKTMHLTMSQHGAYMMLLRWIYTTGKPISDKQCYSIARASLEQEKSDVDFVLSEFFTLIDGLWSNDRALRVMEEQEIKHQKRVSAGKQGGKAKSERSSNAIPMPEQSPTNQNQNQNHIDTNVSIDIPGTVAVLHDGDFQSLWHAYLGIGRNGVLGEAYKGTKHKAQTAYFQLIIKTKEPDRATLIRDIADGANRYAQFLKHSGSISKYLSTWLTDRGWEADYTLDVPVHDHLHQRAGRGQKPSYSDTVFDAASQAIENIRARDTSAGSAWMGTDG